MATRWTFAVPLIGGFVALVTAIGLQRTVIAQRTPNEDVRLAGNVKSTSGENLEGVTVSAKVDGTPMSLSVFTDAQGNFYFPPVAGGQYQVWAQAVGYERVDGELDLAGKAQRHSFVMKPTTDFFSQLTGGQLVAALPEDTPAHRRMKYVFIRSCTSCHGASTALQNRLDVNGWRGIITAMGRISAYGSIAAEGDPSGAIAYFAGDLAEYLAEMRGPGPSKMQLKVPPRPSGDATLAAVYEYDLPLEDGGGYSLNNGSNWSLGPSSGAGGGLDLHDSQVDWNGDIWFTDFPSLGRPNPRTIGKVDGKTGKVTPFRYPGQEKGLTSAGSHGMTIAQDGTIWFDVRRHFTQEAPGSRMLGKMDPKTEKLEVFEPPRDFAGVGNPAVDGKGHIWTSTVTWEGTRGGALHFNRDTQKFTMFDSLTPPGNSYGAAGDRLGNGWWTQIGLDIVGHGNIETKKSFEIKLPPASSKTVSTFFLKDGDLSQADLKVYGDRGAGAQAPRRPTGDPNSDDVWVPNYSGNNLMRINIRTREAKYYPVQWGMNPYMAAVDSRHNVWVSMQGSDEVGRFDPATETWTFFQWPIRGTNLRTLQLLDRNGVLQITGAYFNANRIGRMVIRSRDELQGR